MSQVPFDARLPRPASNDEYLIRLHKEATRAFRELGAAIDLLARGTLKGTLNASAAAPTTGTYAIGDFVKNSAPAEAGGAGSKYIITGWICTASGTPGTWKEARVLTGN